jgi:hypothetical protein
MTDLNDYFRLVCRNNCKLPGNKVRPAYVDQLTGTLS